jgi:peptidase E
MGQGHIVAMGGGGFLMEPDDPALDDFVLGLAGRARPRVLLLAQGSGESDGVIRRFFEAFRGRAEADVLSLFNRDARALRDVVLGQDIVYVSGGNTANLLAIWRVHGVDVLLREFWERGGTLAGVSAGCICWFQSSATDSFGGVSALHDGLGLLGGSACPHYDGEPLRRPTYQRLVGEGVLPAGIALDDFAAAHFVGTRLVEILASREGAAGHLVRAEGGRAVETHIPARQLVRPRRG